jgi:hypothetical protein
MILALGSELEPLLEPDRLVSTPRIHFLFPSSTAVKVYGITILHVGARIYKAPQSCTEVPPVRKFGSGWIISTKRISFEERKISVVIGTITGYWLLPLFRVKLEAATGPELKKFTTVAVLSRPFAKPLCRFMTTI